MFHPIGYVPTMGEENRPRMNGRRKLVDSDLFVADELIALAELPPSGDIRGHKLVITFAGAFDFEVGSSATWVDPSRLLFANPGESYVDHHVVPGVGHSSVIVTPDEATIDEIWNDGEAQFAKRVRACPLQVQMLTQLLRRAEEPLAAQELGLGIMEASLSDARRVSSGDARCVRRAKQMLQDCPDGRLSLTEIAGELGVSAIHLTQTFKRSEGMPLYRYQTLLRLGRALERLPEREDITDLAFELGFSSHSHFTAVFRNEVGMTPSHYRSQARTGSPAAAA
jgi:AraC family transcriptional regulator